MKGVIKPLGEAKAEFFDPDLVELIAKHVKGKMNMTIYITLGAIIGGQVRADSAGPKEAMKMMTTVMAIIADAAGFMVAPVDYEDDPADDDATPITH